MDCVCARGIQKWIVFVQHRGTHHHFLPMPEVDLIPVPGSKRPTHDPIADECSRKPPLPAMSFLLNEYQLLFLSLSESHPLMLRAISD